MQTTISKSTKMRYPAQYHHYEGKRLKRELGTSHFKMVVIKEEIGRSKKGKPIYSSRTMHVYANRPSDN